LVRSDGHTCAVLPGADPREQLSKAIITLSTEPERSPGAVEAAMCARSIRRIDQSRPTRRKAA